MHRVLVIDDEPTLRSSIARGLGRAAELSVEEAGNIEGALRLIDRNAPDVIVSDIDLPDRSGIELLGELGRRGLSIPIIFISAYLKAFRPQIPRHGNIDAFEKPVPLDQLRAQVLSKLHVEQTSEAPFSVADYLQLSCMGRHSVRITATAKDGTKGSIVVRNGEPWFAQYGALEGEGAFSKIAFMCDLSIHCGRVTNEVREARNLEGTMDGLLMEAARLFDEESRRDTALTEMGANANEESTSERAGDHAEQEQRETFETQSRIFVTHWEAAIDALLARDYETALDEFQTAQTINPDDPKVHANLERLHAMGFGSPKDKEQTQ